MDELTILKGILNSLPYPVVFVDNDFVIRYINRQGKYHYYEERGYSDLIGKSLFNCHGNDSSRERIQSAYKKMQQDGKEIFIGVNNKNHRIYMQGVRNEEGNLIGFFERFELNLQK